MTRRTKSSGRLFAAAWRAINASRLPLASTFAKRCFCASAGVAASATRIVSVSLRNMAAPFCRSLFWGEVTALHEEVGQLCGQNHFNPGWLHHELIKL